MVLKNPDRVLAKTDRDNKKLDQEEYKFHMNRFN
jgi:hypothetical protein